MFEHRFPRLRQAAYNPFALALSAVFRTQGDETMRSSVPTFLTVRPSPQGARRTRVAVATGATALVLLCAGEASANAPEFVAALTGRAADQWENDCANATITGDPCDTTICGVNVTIEPGGDPNTRILEVNGKSYNLHDTATNRVDLAAAALLNAVCSVGAGDSFAAASGSFAAQNAQIETFMARGGVSGVAQVRAGTVPMSVLSLGGAYERGSNSSNGFHLPFAFAKNLSQTQFMNISGSLFYATRGPGDTQPDGGEVPGLSQFGFSLTPSFGMEMDQGKTKYAFGGYVPIAYAKASLKDTDESFSAYGVGIGGIGTMSTQLGRTDVSGGLAFAGRKTGGAFALPVSGLVRAVHPVSTMLDGFGSVSYGNDPVGAKLGLLTLGAGVATGEMEFGARAFLSGDYTAVLLGFTYHQQLEGSFALKKPPEEPVEPEAGDKTE